jgi:hypothetical protein
MQSTSVSLLVGFQRSRWVYVSLGALLLAASVAPSEELSPQLQAMQAAIVAQAKLTATAPLQATWSVSPFQFLERAHWILRSRILLVVVLSLCYAFPI